VIRSRVDRKTSTGQSIQEVLAQTEIQHSYALEIVGDMRTNIKKHTAQMALKWATVNIVIPQGNKDKSLPKSIPVTVVEAKEIDNEKGINWIIITTKTVDSIADALEIIQIYKNRWYIEQLHRLLKTEGFRIESSELESGYSIRKLTLICMMAALKILQMMIASTSTEEQNIDFSIKKKCVV
jgi:transposase